MILEALHKAKEEKGIPWRAFWLKVQIELRHHSPAYETMKQHLCYWNKSWRAPNPLCLAVYYRLMTGEKLSEKQLTDCFLFPREGGKPNIPKAVRLALQESIQ